VECKKRLMKNVIAKLAPIREKRLQLERQTGKVRDIIEAGNDRARRESAATMKLVRQAIGLGNSD
jgi:tryptophanyl-tRNA synthetase